MKKIRILEGIRQGKIGGGESYLLGLVENLDREHFEPVVLSFTDGPMVDRLRAQGIETHVIYTETPFDIRVWKKVRNLIAELDIDIVHAHGTRACSNLWWAARRLQLPMIYTCHAWSFHLDQHLLVKKMRIWSEDFLTSRMDVNICGCEANKNTGKQFFRDFDAVVINNSIDSRRFNPFEEYKDIRAGLGIGREELVIVSVARFTSQKQPLKLIRAFARLSARVPNVRLLMIGDGEEKEAAIKLIRSLGMGEKVILQPFRQDIPDVLAGSDIYVLPSLWEAFPIALLEAMSMGKAVIGTNVDGTPEIIRDRDNGLLIGIDDLEADLEKALLELSTDQKLRERLQQNAIRSIYNRYTVENLARKNEHIYRELVRPIALVKNPVIG
ncbi:MAG TPA: glycosyltransferase family 4 protein [Puia sp.]|jgi:glycosyltransferase involved in cell wall biosynthesis|nr:glycosyltransferase family 4 protein [Puia sp.]